MRKIILSITILLISTSAQSESIEQTLLKRVKSQLINTCGKDDLECIKAVNTQLDSCHKNAHKEFLSYMTSAIEDEDEKLGVYGGKVIACMKYADGSPVFEL